MTNSSTNKPLVSVIIPTMNRVEVLIPCLQTVYQNTYSNFEVIVVDNASSDGTVDRVRNLFPTSNVIELPKNVFLAAARNVGAGLATGKYFLFIDDDNEVDSDLISAMVSLFEDDSTIGAAGPKNYYFGEDKLVLWAGQTIGHWTSWTRFRGVRAHDEGQFNDVVDTEGIPNVMMMRRDVFVRLGGYDETYRMSYADADLPMRFRRAGYRTVCNPRAVVYHKIKPDLSRNRMPMRAYYYARNRVIYMKRFSSPLQFAVFFLVFYPLFTLYYIVREVRNRDWNDLRMHIRGTMDGVWYGLTGKIRDGIAASMTEASGAPDLLVERKDRY
ncbi:MAG: glycosyltransferase family 2 protein [Lentisphaerae bacterium]|nr:glycosyltransferase family 2 protein [Lentisphaerota bacterium]